MNTALISATAQLGKLLHQYIENSPNLSSQWKETLDNKIKEAHIQNSWFTSENVRFTLSQWSNLLQEDTLVSWLSHYPLHDFSTKNSKKIGLILAGNIPMVGFHDILCVLFSNHEAMIKYSSKDSVLIPFMLETIQSFYPKKLPYSQVEKLENPDAVIATGSNNTAQYLEYYFRNIPRIIRKNRTSVSILDGNETDEQLQALAGDIFTYFGMGCRNVTRLFIPQNFELSRLFENFIGYGEIINHHAYANNYDYNKAIYLLNQDNFWDNNFIMLKEDKSLFSPISVLHFSRYDDLEEVKQFLFHEQENIQCIIANPIPTIDTFDFGKAQSPAIDTYADHIDTIAFLSNL